ncbi:Dfp1/Him1, central region-domain-containing protein [Microdochium trichocladiopsis]|uniref:Dfp1/Him1, central region-domain-containing protein n=1 Tax=Microdochium trichocladiopsis TaxID=1682393 RepID=A0A9P9BUG4_9PEZI|nr:Dfp1/Him1, central region-domain-containing protein [Microdochium trichocladiopsis]KAH7040961.1 Dfp1/Him1, central region-domain-containing protein [Microdochium trichocladiopsis]
MSGRRVLPLQTNINAANSPLRPSAAAASHAAAAGMPLKPRRTLPQPVAAHRDHNRDAQDTYAEQPPAKKQIVENVAPSRLLKSPSQQSRATSRSQPVFQQRTNATTYRSKVDLERTRPQHASQQLHQQIAAATNVSAVEQNSRQADKSVEDFRNWQKHHRAKFPKMVFFFDHIPTEARHKLAKQISQLGSREEKFFSIEITHVITTRSIPTDKGIIARDSNDGLGNVDKDDTHMDQEHEQLQTIDPKKLSRPSEIPVKRKLFDAELRSRQIQPQIQQDVLRVMPKRNTDILLRAREMGKKIWSLDKLQRMLPLLLEQDPYVSMQMTYGSRTQAHESRASQDRNLLQLLHNERVNGPSDRDPTVAARELHYFKGPYLYIYDMDEKQKPIMVREYEKVADKADGDWPQFRTAAVGRCPFVEDYDHREARHHRPKPAAAAAASRPAVEVKKPVIQPPEVQPSKPITGKRTLSEMEQSHSRNSSVASIEVAQSLASKRPDSRGNAFTSRAAAGRLFGGEPVASGLQPSNITSAIRSQMISSTAATPGVITGLSKEVHGLQRQVLKRNSTATSQDFSSRRAAEAALREETGNKRPSTLARTSSKKLDQVDEAFIGKGDDSEISRAMAQPEKRPLPKPKKRELKPGYCENCVEKYNDFDEHIVSRKHRRFADDDRNWVELDELLAQLQRVPKHVPFQPRAVSFTDDDEQC